MKMSLHAIYLQPKTQCQQYLNWLYRFWPNFKFSILRSSLTINNYQKDFCPGNICHGDNFPISLTWFVPKIKVRFLWPYFTGHNCPNNICPVNILIMWTTNFFIRKTLGPKNSFGPKISSWLKSIFFSNFFLEVREGVKNILRGGGFLVFWEALTIFDIFRGAVVSAPLWTYVKRWIPPGL